MELTEQTVTVDLPTLLIDARGSSVQTTEPGLEMFGYLSVTGTATVGFSVACVDDDPSQLRLTVRPLTAHYEAPAGCSTHVLETVNRVNRDLAARMIPAA